MQESGAGADGSRARPTCMRDLPKKRKKIKTGRDRGIRLSTRGVYPGRSGAANTVGTGSSAQGAGVPRLWGWLRWPRRWHLSRAGGNAWGHGCSGGPVLQTAGDTAAARPRRSTAYDQEAESHPLGNVEAASVGKGQAVARCPSRSSDRETKLGHTRAGAPAQGSRACLAIWHPRVVPPSPTGSDSHAQIQSEA